MQPFLGQVQLFAYASAPQGWMACSGPMLPIEDNAALFEIIGNAYGGGASSFALPNLPPPTPNGPYYLICVEGIVPQPGPPA